MADEKTARKPEEDVTTGRPHFAPTTNAQQGSDDVESVIADNDLGMRGAGAAGENAGSGVPGLGGSPGGTPNAGGVGLPGGNQRLGAGQAPTPDAGLGGTTASGGLGIGGNPQSGHGQTPSTDVLPGGATRSTGSHSVDDNARSRSTPGHPIPEEPTPGMMDHPGPEAET